MTQYMITYSEDKVILESIGKENKKSVQLTTSEFCLLMQYPKLSKEEVLEELWKIFDKERGKAECERTLDLAWEFLGRK